MASTFQDARDGVDKYLKDKDRKLTPQDLDNHIVEAVRIVSPILPRIVAKEITGDGSFEYALPSDFDSDFSAMKAVFYPYDASERNPTKLESKEWELFQTPTGETFRFRLATPLLTEKFLLVYTKQHTATPAGGKVKSELLPEGSVIAAETFSNVIDTDTASTVRVYLHIAAVLGELDVIIQISEDGVVYSDVGAFDLISATGNFIEALQKEKVGSKLRLKFTPSGGGSFTLEASADQTDVSGTMTVPTAALHLVNMKAAQLGSIALANFYSGLVDNTLEGDVTDFEGKGNFWQANADKIKELYDEAVNQVPKRTGITSGGQGEWDIHGSANFEYLTHPSIFR